MTTDKVAQLRRDAEVHRMAHQFREAMVPRADLHSGHWPAWHGWVIVEAYLAGYSAAQKGAAPQAGGTGVARIYSVGLGRGTKVKLSDGREAERHHVYVVAESMEAAIGVVRRAYPDFQGEFYNVTCQTHMNGQDVLFEKDYPATIPGG